MEYVLIVHEAQEGGFWAEVPALDGCFGQGESLPELYADMQAAIRSHIEALRHFGDGLQAAEHVLLTTVSLPGEPAA